MKQEEINHWKGEFMELAGKCSTLIEELCAMEVRLKKFHHGLGD